MCSICPNNCVHAWEGFDFSDLCVLWAFQLRSTRVSTFFLYQQKTNWKNLLTKCVKCYQVCHLDFTKCYKVSPRCFFAEKNVIRLYLCLGVSWNIFSQSIQTCTNLVFCRPFQINPIQWINFLKTFKQCTCLGGSTIQQAMLKNTQCSQFLIIQLCIADNVQ